MNAERILRVVALTVVCFAGRANAQQQAPLITSADSTLFTVGVAGSFTITTSGYPTAAVTEGGALPNGVAFVDNGDGTATLSGTPMPTSGGAYNLSVGATNGNPPDAQQSFALTVDEGPAITSANSATFTAGAAGSFTVTTTGYPPAAVTESGPLPGGVTLVDNGDGTATLSGTAAAPGQFAVTVTAANGVGADAAQIFTLTVGTAMTAPAITSANGATFTAGAAGSFTVTTTGSPTPAITEIGALPGGVTWVDNGDGTATLSGIAAAPGQFAVTITAANGVGANAVQSFTLTVGTATTAPAITSANGVTFTAGTAGSFVVTTTGSPTPAITESGTLPGGVTLVDNGDGTATLSGTAAAPGQFAVTVTAANGIGVNAVQSFTLTIAKNAAMMGVLTQDYDIGRTAANLGETTLNPGNVSATTFGKLFAYPVDEEVFAQPLYVPNLTIAGAKHNVVFVATMGNSVFAFDADSASASNTPLWSVNLGPPVPSSAFLFSAGSGLSHSGIYSTPTIDPLSGTIYVVTHSWNAPSQATAIQLHALDITNGSEKFGGPAQFSATSVPGFDPNANEQRAGLLLLNGIVYIALASHADVRLSAVTRKNRPYLGLVLAYDAQTLSLVGSFNAEAGGVGASLWQGGRGLASDGYYVYGMTANAFTLGKLDYSESFVQLNPGTLSVADYYRDPDSACLNKLDLDLSSSGPQVIPEAGASVLVGGGKQGKVYELQLNQPLSTQSPQYFWGTNQHLILPAEGGSCADPRVDGHGQLQSSDTAFWNNPAGASYYYAFGSYDQLISWQVSGNTFTQMSADTPVSAHHNAVAVSANGGTGGVLWTLTTGNPAIVSAYNAVPSGGHLALLWSSAHVPQRDALGQLGRYSVPTIANGKVYVSTGSNQVAVYGLLPATPSIQVTPKSATVTFTALNPSSQTIDVNAYAGYAGKVTLTLTGLPAGVTYSFSKATVPLTSAKPTVGTTLTISPAGAALPLNDNYTVMIKASAAGGATAYAPLRLLMRSAKFTAAKVDCDPSNNMSADLTWQINGSGVPSIWIQDATSPNFPGRLWIEPAPAVGSETTDHSIASKNNASVYWAIDQSAGLPAVLDNAFAFSNLSALYKCP